MIVVLTALACTSWFGLEVLDEVPTDFPVTLRGEAGQVTRTEGGHVAVDEVHTSEQEARTAWAALRAEAKARGYTNERTDRRKKREVLVLEGPEGRVELQCCAQRADRKWLVLVSWFPSAG